ncbi:MAG: 16S rRNA (cytosine(1402)-N(4))-methyltransferase RsmH [Chloroflexi bacterium]|nr:16S rRNA (cytosine(1402)-N(4))-methyltransferase RsmH [Chloroflexota bacterium]
MHVSVLYKEVIEGLQPKSGGRYIDGTTGAGGHAFGILESSSPKGELLGLDRDPSALKVARERLKEFGDRLHLRQASYVEMENVAREIGWGAVNGIILDLGLSSLQLEDAARGFAFKHEGPLDMRFDSATPITAADLVNGGSPDELADILFKFGEEHNARRIVKAILKARPINTTQQLAAVVAATVGGKRGDVHPATRTFQALRIAVNGELDAVEKVLPLAVGLLAVGGRLAVISFHSLEDRLVKNFFRREARDCLCPPEQVVCVCRHKASVKEITRKPMTPSEGELRSNPRSRSAKLRIVEKILLA